jgi:uncharacterized membrane protein YgdD (TMEM256/DUF423 family)
MHRIGWLIGTTSAFIGVGAGAFGAHALDAVLAPDLLEVWETAVRYQLFHALALLVLAVAAAVRPDRRWAIPIWLFALGTVLFSGSLYLLALTGISYLGAVTPLGGVAFLAGWIATGAVGWRVFGPAGGHEEGQSRGGVTPV